MSGRAYRFRDNMTEISSVALITRIFLKGANERNTRQRQEIIFSRAYEALRAV